MLDCGTVDSRGVSLPCIAPGTERADGEAIYPAGNDVTCHLEVRRAINAGINRQQMVDRVLAGYGYVAYSVSDNMPWYSDAMEVTFDQSAARKYMEDAGWTEGADGIYELDGLRAAFTLHYAASDSVRQALAAEMANQLKEIGIDATIEGGSWDELYPLEYSEPILWGWGSNSPSELYNLHYSSGWGNFACYDNDAVDAHLDAALATTTIEESYPEWQAAQWDGTQGFAPEGGASWVWLVNVDHLYYKREKLNVANQKLHPHGHGWSLVNNVDTWSWN
jgi:peptide/nickel transport system substrate-binding protein